MRVFVGSGCAALQTLISTLAARGAELYDVEIVHLLTFGAAPYASRDWIANFWHNAFFIGPNVRNSVNEGCSDYTPIHLSEVPHDPTSSDSSRRCSDPGKPAGRVASAAWEFRWTS